jgi:hypothetical protein
MTGMALVSAAVSLSAAVLSLVDLAARRKGAAQVQLLVGRVRGLEAMAGIGQREMMPAPQARSKMQPTQQSESTTGALSDGAPSEQVPSRYGTSPLPADATQSRP